MSETEEIESSKYTQEEIAKAMCLLNRIEPVDPIDGSPNWWAFSSIVRTLCAVIEYQRDPTRNFPTGENLPLQLKDQTRLSICRRFLPKGYTIQPNEAETQIASPFGQGGISDRLSNFDDWGDRIRGKT